MKFGIGVLYMKLSTEHEFCENRLTVTLVGVNYFVPGIFYLELCTWNFRMFWSLPEKFITGDLQLMQSMIVRFVRIRAV